MKKFLTISFLLIFSFFSSFLNVQSQSTSTLQTVDYIFCNGNIITIDEVNPVFEAIAINDGEIVERL